MRRLQCALLATAAVIGFATIASAADMPVKAPMAPLAASWNWTGFYLGVAGGGGWGRSTQTDTAGTTTGSYNQSGGIFGGTIGYNLQTGSLVLGLEGDFDASWIKGTETASCGTPGCETKNTWFGTARGRIGYAWDRYLPFITGGAAFGDIKMTTPVSTSQTTTNVGWTVGGGVEYAFMGPWSAKIEYLYADLGKGKCDIGPCGGLTGFESPLKVNLVRLCVNYRF